ncbi:hypothetical protein Hgul01_01266 [Herpetosiphon gulosus]|uniref:PPM-type phosphatase domain-containing protein n=2 Tax=Herpetosiphon gulosus TaxID=1973496 RepID=A0ABP9WW84_9CHLR
MAEEYITMGLIDIKSTKNIEDQTDSVRKSVFFNTIINVVIYIHLFFIVLIFITSIINQEMRFMPMLILAIDMSYFLFIKYVSKKVDNNKPYIIFCAYSNLMFMALAATDSSNSVNLFMYMCSICIMLFTFLVNYQSALIAFFINMSIIFYLIYQPNFAWIADLLPILSFFVVTTAIAWLYQRTLDNSMISLQAARQQLMQDTLIRQELAIARNLQQELYPKPQHYSECLDIGASVQPALETSGDLYDLIRLNDDEIAIIVGDATGKSVAAAMVMAMTRSIIRSEARRSRNPGHVLRHVNAILHADDAVNQMMTVWYGVLNLRHHQLRFANAGHPFPLLRRNGVVQELEAFGTPLRSIRNFPYAEQTIQLQANDRLVVYTDGVIETMNEQRELYSFDRWCAAVRDIEAENTAGLIDAYCAAVDEFRGAARQADDLTLVVVDIIKDPSEVVTLPVADTTAVVVTADQ